jgi:hypothetical protein
MGHAGAIISGGSGTAAEKMAAFEAAGVPVARIPSEIPGLIAELLQRRRTRQKNGLAKKAEPAKANGKAARANSKPAARALANGRGTTARPKKKVAVAAGARKSGGRTASGKKKH